MPTITGTTGPDTLVGTDDDDLIIGGGDFDTISGRDGNDVIDGMGQLSGGNGDDRIVLRWPTNETRTSLVTGNAGTDTLDLSQIILQPGINSINASLLADGDTIVGAISRGGSGIVYNVFRASEIERIIGWGGEPGGGNFSYNLSGRTAPIEIIGGAAYETFWGGSGRDVFRAGGGADTLYIGLGDQAFGEDGDDRLFVQSHLATGGALADGGAGNDTLTVQILGAFEGINLATGGNADFGVRGIETLIFELGAGYSSATFTSTIIGDAGNNVLRFTRSTASPQIGTTIYIHGGDGNDTISSAGTSDRLYGEAGDDVISGSGLLDGGEGDDILTGAGQLFGGSGDDLLIAVEAYITGSRFSVAGYSVDGGAGIDTFRFNSTSSFNYTISLATGLATGARTGATWEGSLTITGVENVIGGNLNDIIEGDGGANRLQGLGGDDNIQGGGGDDVLYGDAGNEILDGGTGSDQLFGGAGTDRLDGGDGDDQLFGGDGTDTLFGGAGDDLLDGGAGADTLFGGAGDDVMVGGAGLDTFDGGEGHDTVILDFVADLATITYENGNVIISSPQGREVLTSVEQVHFTDAIYTLGSDGRLTRAQTLDQIGTSAPDRLTGTSGSDRLVGLAGDDFLIGGAGSDVLDGGAGIDTAGYYSLFRSYRITQVNGAPSTVTGGVERGTDTLVSIERLSFLDGTLYTDTDSSAARLYRLYDATFDRAPDQAGLAAWVDIMARGTTLAQAAQIFATAPEFLARYGDLSNQDFVRTMYRFSLNREADGAGLAGWTRELDRGVSRGDILLAFSEIQEHRNLTAAAVAAGVFVQDERTIAVARLYDAAFDRVPDREGIAYWRGTLETGGSLVAIANAFVSSQEFQDRYGALNNQQFIEQMYRFTLNREADALGLQVWTDRLNAGTTRAEMVVIFSESAEHIALTAPLWQGGVRFEAYVEPASAPVETIDGKSIEALTLPDDAFITVGQPDDVIVFDLDDDGFATPVVAGLDDVKGLSDEAQILPDPTVLMGDHHHTDWM